MEQAVVISELQTITDELRQEIQRLRVSRDLDSQTWSKPRPAIYSKQEFKKQQSESTENSGKRRPGDSQDILEKPEKDSAQ